MSKPGRRPNREAIKAKRKEYKEVQNFFIVRQHCICPVAIPFLLGYEVVSLVITFGGIWLAERFDLQKEKKASCLIATT